MTDSTVLGFIAFGAGVCLLLVLATFVVWLARYVADYRDLRRREAAYAEAWVRTHRAHQDRDRYITDRPGAPE